MQPLNEDSAAAVLQLADARFGMASALLKLAEKARREAAEGLIVDKLEEEFEKEMVGIEKLTAHGLVGVDLWLDGRVQGTMWQPVAFVLQSFKANSPFHRCLPYTAESVLEQQEASTIDSGVDHNAAPSSSNYVFVQDTELFIKGDEELQALTAGRIAIVQKLCSDDDDGTLKRKVALLAMEYLFQQRAREQQSRAATFADTSVMPYTVSKRAAADSNDEKEPADTN
eukprot:7732-Heterococcus_DN1.PRE.1